MTLPTGSETVFGDFVYFFFLIFSIFLCLAPYLVMVFCFQDRLLTAVDRVARAGAQLSIQSSALLRLSPSGTLDTGARYSMATETAARQSRLTLRAPSAR